MNGLSDCNVILLCGISGSGKTTFARHLTKFGFIHLSLDGIMWDEFGDFSPEDFMTYSQRADEILRQKLAECVASGRKAVVDATLCKRAKRDSYRSFLDTFGARYGLVYCSAEPQVLRERLCRRNEHPGREAAIVTDDMLDRFLAGFEPPMSDEAYVSLPTAAESFV